MYFKIFLFLCILFIHLSNSQLKMYVVHQSGHVKNSLNRTCWKKWTFFLFSCLEVVIIHAWKVKNTEEALSLGTRAYMVSRFGEKILLEHTKLLRCTPQIDDIHSCKSRLGTQEIQSSKRHPECWIHEKINL